VDDVPVKLTVLAYLSLNAGILAYLGVKYLMEQRQARRVADVEWLIRERNARFLRDLNAFCVPPRPRVEPYVCMTPHGSEMGWLVRASCEQEAVEILVALDV
jgi:hypothetical protein